MENIAFVTGSTGRIGNELTSILIKNKFTVVCVGRFQKNSTLDVKFLQNENKSLKFSEEIIYDKWIEISCGDGYSLLVCDVLNKNNKSIINKIKSGERFFTPLKKLFDSKSERTRFGIKGFYRS